MSGMDVRRPAALALATASIGLGAAPAAAAATATADTPASISDAAATPAVRSAALADPGDSVSALLLRSVMVLVGGAGGVVLFRRPMIYFAPSRRRTAGTVRARMTRSRPKDHVAR